MWRGPFWKRPPDESRFWESFAPGTLSYTSRVDAAAPVATLPIFLRPLDPASDHLAPSCDKVRNPKVVPKAGGVGFL
jgi:hypothetical protein